MNKTTRRAFLKVAGAGAVAAATLGSGVSALCGSGKKKSDIRGDMSCPGAALIQTASFQARLPGVTSIEANARQFLPAA